MRIVFMGTPDPAALVLRSLIGAGHAVACVVTQPDRPKGRGRALAFPPVKELALQCELPVEQPEKVKGNKEFISFLESLSPDIIVVVAYGNILPREVLDIPKFGCVNVHASLLPKYRGAAPIQWALLNGEKETGVTIMRIDASLDTGEIILQKKIGIAEDDSTPTLSQKLFDAGSELLLEALRQIENNKACFVPQNNAQASYAPALTKESGEIDWRKSALEIHNRIRAVVPWPVANTFRKEKTLKIWKSEIHVLDLAGEFKAPGTIVEIVKNEGFIVAAGSGHILVKEVQAGGGKRMPAYNFVIGHDVKIRETLPN